MMNRRPTTQDISWFLDLHNTGQLNLDPPYQRRSVWTSKDKKFFLDTIFRDYPCPAIFLHKSTEGGKQTYNVVDGKQRLETIIEFTNNKIALPKDFGDASLNGKKWKDIKDDATLNSKFWDYILTVEMVKTLDGTILNNVFDRLNRNSRKLERQELRHARFDGWFITFAEAESEKEEWRQLKIVTTTRARRMKDVQFISELMQVILENKMIGFDQDSLDALYAEFENPEEYHPDFNEEEFKEYFNKSKQIIIAMEGHNECITNYTTSVNHFYTLWAVIWLGNIADNTNEDQLADRYKVFMKKVLELIENREDLDSFYEDHDKEEYKNAYKYMTNSLGASTDLTQREGRIEALNNELFEL